MAWTQNLLGLCLFGCAPDAAFLGFAWWLQFRSGWGTISLFIGFRGSKSNVSRFLRLQFRNGLDAKHAGALPFRMRSRRSFLRLCLVAEVSQWLGHDFIVFRGSKSNVSRFLRLQFRNGLDAKPAGLLPFRMRSRRSFLTLCLVADPRSGCSTFSLRLYSCNGLDAKPAGALPFRMRSRRSFLRLCLVADVSQWLGHDFIVFSNGSVSQWFGCKTFDGLAFFLRPSSQQLLPCVRLCPVAAVSQWLGHDFIVLGIPKATFRDF